ncbi:alpha/beta hydrolase [Aliikangiella marina]|nr:alpha/beta hydrolase [Aliikangiella marina]
MLTKSRLSNTFIVIILWLINGCSTNKYQHQELFEKYELIQKIERGERFNHLLVSNRTSGKKLHIYLEGDGVPWISRYKISQNPTPYNPLALKLLLQDRDFALYVGRPCYFELHQSKNCTPQQWTNGRYGHDVIDSMEKVIRRFIRSTEVEQVIFIGYSGGGVIASLLAERFQETQLLITIAANLDTFRWTNYHDYSPLDLSINPATNIEAMSVPNIHLVGANDTIVPPELTKDFIQKLGGELILFPDYDHQCCWHENWSDTLDSIIDQQHGFQSR